MRQVRVQRDHVVAVQAAEEPSPGPGEVLVRTRLTGICGSDTHAVAGAHPLLPPPYFPGHEACGTVVALGAGVQGVDAGQRVALKPNVSCGQCLNCAAGRDNACEHLAWIGCDPTDARPGAMAELFVAPAENVYPVPEDLSDEEAVLIECLATPVHAARIAGDLTGARVLVIGAGTIGLLALLAARNAGAATVVVSDLDEGKRARALRHGAERAVDASSASFDADVRDAAGGPIDVVLDCVANQHSARQGVAALRRAGSLVVIGVPAGEVTMPMAQIQDAEIRVQGSASYTAVDFQAALAIAAAGGIPAADIVTSTRGFDEAAQAFAEAAANASGKVLLHP